MFIKTFKSTFYSSFTKIISCDDEPFSFSLEGNISLDLTYNKVKMDSTDKGGSGFRNVTYISYYLLEQIFTSQQNTMKIVTSSGDLILLKCNVCLHVNVASV